MEVRLLGRITMTTLYDPNKYGKLLVATLPGVIETEEENEQALEIVWELMKKGENGLSPEEDRLIRLLVRLIEDFEDKAYPMDKVAPLDILKGLMLDHGLKQNDLVDIFGSQSIVSEVLNGKRKINAKQAKRLAARFRLTADIFI